MPYDVVLIVYNPHSTGGAEHRARDLATELADRAPDLEVTRAPTEYPGHATEIAREAAGGRPTLVVSVSGDGGYNEVVSGAMSGAEHGGVTVAVLPAGNANDHRRATRHRPLAQAIVDGAAEPMDLLRVDIAGEPVRWAHSYIGLGITPVVALELEKGRKGSLSEIVTTMREFAKFRPFEVTLESGERQRFDSLVLANIAGMAKYAKLSDDGDPTDGLFEVAIMPHSGRLRLLARAIGAATRGLGRQPRSTRFTFTTTSPMPVQLDGEVLELGAERKVIVEIAPRAVVVVR